MIKVYGSHMCSDCRELISNFDANRIRYEFVDINDNLKYLRKFLRMRDTLSIFDNCRKIGDIGLPCLVPDDGEPTLKWKEWLKDHGYQMISE